MSAGQGQLWDDRCPHGYPARIDGTGIGCGACARDRGMANAEARRGADWDAKVIRQAIGHLAASGEEFSANEVRAILPAVSGPLIGAGFRRAHQRGEIEVCGTVQAAHEAGHRRTLLLWRGRRQAALFEREDTPA